MTTRRIRALAALAALLPLAALPDAASAQASCVAGSLADYVALADGCQLDGISFTGFTGAFSGFVPQPPAVTVTPVAGGGLVGFGLAFAPAFAVSGFGADGFDFRFMVSGVGIGGTLGLSAFSLFTAVVDASQAGRTRSAAEARTSVVSESDGGTVTALTGKLGNLPATSQCAIDAGQVACGPYVSIPFQGGPVRLTGLVTSLGVPALPASASLSNLSVLVGVGAPPPPVTVTSEPASVLLVASGVGLLGLAGAWRRRRLVDAAAGRTAIAV